MQNSPKKRIPDTHTIRKSMRENSLNHRGTNGNNISNDTLAPVNNHTWILKPKSRQFFIAETHFTGDNE